MEKTSFEEREKAYKEIDAQILKELNNGKPNPESIKKYLDGLLAIYNTK